MTRRPSRLVTIGEARFRRDHNIGRKEIARRFGRGTFCSSGPTARLISGGNSHGKAEFFVSTLTKML
jgi:hypothetical protein